MSKQIFVDENGNEILISGTVNTADMMPMSGNDSTKVSEAIAKVTTYTSTERVYGEWIDGSTIYEKTVDFGSQVLLTNGAWNTVTGFSETVQPIEVICFDTTNKNSVSSIVARSNSNQLQLRPFTGGNEYVTGYILRYMK